MNPVSLTSAAIAAVGILLRAAALPALPAPPPVEVTGRWVFDSQGRPIPPESFRRGLQPSGLALRKGELWSLGDQRSEFPGHLFRIDPRTARLAGKPIPLELAAKKDGESPELEAYRGIPRSNPDFEGLALAPGDDHRLLALTEDKVPWIADIRIEDESGGPRARIAELTRIQYPAGLASWNDNPNYGFEGIAVSDDGQTVYLAFERAKDDLPRIYRLPFDAACSGKQPLLEEIAIPFASIPRRADKDRALLNVNDIQFLRFEGRAALLAVLRDQERLLLIDLDRKECSRLVDLNLRDPAGGAIQWVSPEGLAIDAKADAVWLINDPDSERSNYRKRDAAAPDGELANYTPLLFEVKLSRVLAK